MKDKTKEWLKFIFIVLILSFSFSKTIQASLVSGQSMEPNYEDGDYLIGIKLGKTIHRGDVVTLSSKKLTEEKHQPMNNLIKRVIALPNEEVEVKNGIIYIDGKPLEENYIKEKDWDSPDSYYKLSNNEYFVLGDNRNNSYDSRFFGPIEEDAISSKVKWKPLGPEVTRWVFWWKF